MASQVSKRLRCFVQDSPLGPLKVTTSDLGLCSIDFGSGDLHQLNDQKTEKIEGSLEYEVFQCLKRYFQGEFEAFKNIPLDIQSGTPFQRAVWQTLIGIPYGRVYTYRWLSEEAGYPKAYRAVGQANRRNPIPIVIPCHRILNANGNLGGYQGKEGVAIKRFLLQLEGAL